VSARDERIARGREGVTVIGCVYCAWRTLTERHDGFPSYDWCEQQWTATLRKRAPGSAAVPAWLEQELWCLWRREEAVGRPERYHQPAMVFGGAA
jgi:hypothetical protein